MKTPAQNRKHVYRGLLIALVIAFGVKAALVYRSNWDPNRQTKDYIRWYKIAKLALEGGPLADPAGGEAAGLRDKQSDLAFFKLPPAFGFYVAPLGALPYLVYVEVWYWLLVAAAAASVLLAMKIVHGRWFPHEPVVFLIPVLLFVPLVMDELHSGNNNLPVLVCLVLGAFFASRNRQLPAGLAIGMAISLKAFPAAILIALFVMWRWRLLTTTLIGVVLWTLVVPGLVRGFEPTVNDNVAWFNRIIRPYMEGSEQRQWDHKDTSGSNQALWGQVQRFTRHVDAHKTWNIEFYVNVADLSMKGAAMVFAAILLVILRIIARVCDRGPPLRTPTGWAVELSIAMLFMLLASPIAWTYYYNVLILPMAVAGRVLLDGPRRLRILCVWAFALTLALMLAALDQYARAFGPLAWLGVMWLAVMCVFRARVDELGGPDSGLAALWPDQT